MSWHIYSLTDPRNGRVRYVGKTNNIRKRLCSHVQEALHRQEHNHRCNWIRSLLSAGQTPSLSILESGDGDWVVAEKKWIKNFRDAGYDLVNATDGGEGAEGYTPSAETRAKMSRAHKGRSHSEEFCIQCRERALKQWKNPEHRARITDSQKKRWQSSELRARQSSACKGRTHSAETRAKMSAAAQARAATTSARMKGHRVSAESRAKIGVASRARSAAISACMKARWAAHRSRES